MVAVEVVGGTEAVTGAQSVRRLRKPSMSASMRVGIGVEETWHQGQTCQDCSAACQCCLHIAVITTS
jgi:hypothetical protein